MVLNLDWLTNGNMTPNCLLLDSQSETFLIQILIYKNRTTGAVNWLGQIWRCPWCNGYRHRKWIRRHEFKSWTRLIAFHIARMPLGKVWIQLFSFQLWVLQPWRRKNEFKAIKFRLKIDLVSYPALVKGLVNMVWADLRRAVKVTQEPALRQFAVAS